MKLNVVRTEEVNMVGFINRDAYGFSVRPHHVQRYREYVKIYKVLVSTTFIFFYMLKGLVCLKFGDFISKLCYRETHV